MTKDQIKEILERVLTWPAERQQDAMHILLTLEERDKPYVLSEDELADIECGLAEADRGEFATDEEVKAVFDRYR